MKTSSEADRKLTRAKAVNCIIVNQLATPGLGSWLVGRRLEGTGQLALASAGFCMIVGWFMKMIIGMFREMNGGRPYHASHAWLWKVGLVLFGAAWCWSLATSLSVLNAAPKSDVEGGKNPADR